MVGRGLGRRVDDILTDALAYAVVSLFAAATVYPFANVLAVSVSEYSSYLTRPLMVVPTDLNFSAYRVVLGNPLFASGYRNTVAVTLAGVVVGVALTVLTAYPLSRQELRGKRVFMTVIVVTMLFNGGLIPNFYLIRRLGLIDRLWALILPPALTGFHVILMKNFFSQIPDSIEESARIDGASDLTVLIRIVVPLSKPIIATIALFLAVMYWNNFFLAVVYILNSR